MSIKRTLSLISILGGLIPIFIWLYGKTGSVQFMSSAGIVSFIAMVLLLYAWIREHKSDDTSDNISRKYVVLILGGISLWVLFCFYRALYQ